MRNITAQLMHWKRCKMGDLDYLTGDIVNDSKGRWRDGTGIHTSYIVHEEDIGDSIIFTTRNSVYECLKDSEYVPASKRL